MRSLLWIAVGAFAIGTEGFMIAGLLPAVASDTGVSLAVAGQLVTVFSLTYALGSPLLAVAAGDVDRRRLLLGSLAVFASGNVLAALAHGYAVLVVARVTMALAASTYMPAASAYAAAVAAPERRGRALSVIYVGVTLATVLGVPLGVLVGGRLGWRASFAGVAALAALTIVGVARAVAPGHRGQAATLAQRLAAARRPEVLSALALTVLALTGTFVVYTYLAPFLRLGIGWDGARVATALFLFGAGGAVGNVLGGIAADRVSSRRLLSAVFGGLALVFALLSVAVRALPAALAAPVVLALVLLWGIVGWAYPSVQQARLVRLDPGLAAVTLSLNASATYLGISLGAFVGAVAVAHGGVLGTGWLACGSELLGLALLRVVPAAGSERALPGPSATTAGLETWAARGEHG